MPPRKSSPDTTRTFVDVMQKNWRRAARPNQLPPPGDWWFVWLLMAGRGFGKTESGGQYARALAESGVASHIALVGQTSAAVREVMIERLLAIAPNHNRPLHQLSRGRLVWPNGVVATSYSAEQAERLRGPQHSHAWLDELASFRNAEEVWSTLLLGLRIGARPRVVITATPRPTKLIRDLVSREGKDVVITRGASRENAANLAPGFLSELASRYAGTRLGRQEVEGELLQDVPGAIFPHELLDATRVACAPAELERIVIGVDPAGSTSEGADETGIVAAGRGADGHAYVLADYSGKYTPEQWARAAITAYHTLRADKIVVERNFGGDMAAATIASIDPNVPVKAITSSRGKVLRAEPISALFVQHRAHLVGDLPQLADQMAAFTSDWNRARDGSPDRIDAAIFALTELVIEPGAGAFFDVRALLMPGDEESIYG